MQLAHPGPAPDCVGVFVGDLDVGAIAADAAFVYQGASNAKSIGDSIYTGRYLSYQ